MHPAIKTLLISMLIGLSFGIYLYFTYDQRLARILISVLSTATIGSLMMMVIYNRHYFTMFTGQQSIKVIIMICLLLAVALTGTEITLVLQSLLLPDQPYLPFRGGSIYILNILIVLVTGIPIYVSEEWKIVLNNRILHQQYRLLQLEQQQTVFELELLRAKINPHFLYNMHNTIAGLISKDPSKAEELVILLSRFFRSTLNKNSATFHTVSDELEIITTYLHMQQIRYENRMRYTIEADPATMQLEMPSFILQPLVENAVKHGIEAGAGPGSIEVKITLEGSNLLITVADSGPGFPDQPGGGQGLQMVLNKLKLLYADNFNVELNNTPHKYVRITIPGRDQHTAGR